MCTYIKPFVNKVYINGLTDFSEIEKKSHFLFCEFTKGICVLSYE